MAAISPTNVLPDEVGEEMTRAAAVKQPVALHRNFLHGKKKFALLAFPDFKQRVWELIFPQVSNASHVSCPVPFVSAYATSPDKEGKEKRRTGGRALAESGSRPMLFR